MQGFIIENIANLYKIKDKDNIFEATARGKFKKDEITPVVGDFVEYDIIDQEKKKAVITEIKERKVYIKKTKNRKYNTDNFCNFKQRPKARLINVRQTISICRILTYKKHNCFK